jgi:hypothetical protein
MDGFSESSKRGNASAKRVDLTDLRAALRDGRAWTSIGQVYLPPGETSHFDLEPDQSGNGTDVLVHVQQMPNGEPLLCRLACSGVWRIPPVGWEVDLIIPDGELEGGAYIVGAHTTGTVPAALDGDTLTGEAPKVNLKATAGDSVLDASGSVLLGGGTLAVVIANTGTPTAMGLVDWMAAVTSAVNGLAPGSLTGPSGYSSAKVKA